MSKLHALGLQMYLDSKNIFDELNYELTILPEFIIHKILFLVCYSKLDINIFFKNIIDELKTSYFF